MFHPQNHEEKIMKNQLILLVAFIQIFLPACTDQVTDSNELNTSGELLAVPDWTDSSHSNDVAPNYSMVFPQNEVLRIDVKIDAAEWATMINDLQENIGAGTNRGPGGGPGSFSDFDPIWVTSSVYFRGVEWYKVGVRFKGNSSLRSTYRAGINKLSFKLDFDQFEDEYPLIKNQRFYGFKQLNLKNNFEDASMMREKVASDLFREFGLVSPEAAFCELYVDHGEGPQYFGLYTLVEEVDDSVLETQFGDDTGNLYKPDGNAASFAMGTFNEEEMDLKNNEENADYSNVYALYTVLHDTKRITSRAEWQAQLEAIFDVKVFLKWLAANTVMQNWDTYGLMTHNYYLYDNPASGKLTWIPWDNNESLQSGKMGGALSLSLDEVSDNWPLIRYLANVPEYKQTYRDNIKSFAESVFTPAAMIFLYENYNQLIKEYAYKEIQGYSFLSNTAQFDQAVDDLKNHVKGRQLAVEQYLGR